MRGWEAWDGRDQRGRSHGLVGKEWGASRRRMGRSGVVTGRRPAGRGARCPRAVGRPVRGPRSTPPQGPGRAGGGAGRGERRISALSISAAQTCSGLRCPRPVTRVRTRAPICTPQTRPRPIPALQSPPVARHPHARGSPGPRRPIRAAAAAAAVLAVVASVALCPRGASGRIGSP